jgi:hypothetical protein
MISGLASRSIFASQDRLRFVRNSDVAENLACTLISRVFLDIGVVFYLRGRPQ